MSLLNPKSYQSSDPFAQFADSMGVFEKILSGAKSKLPFLGTSKFWYPYNTLASVREFDSVLTGERRDLIGLIGDKPFADIGAADGDLAFFIESFGVKNVNIIDHAASNCNALEGAKRLKQFLNSSVRIHDMDLDAAYSLPEKRFGLVALLGSLYHLKNPFLMLETLGRHADYCLISTRIAAYLPGGRKKIASSPLAYLLDSNECNNDSTNFWVFTEAGLKRLLSRAGWDILDFGTCGSKKSSPDSMERTQRAFCLVRSRVSRSS
jgi:tRNA (mo5U34)-methyltransferase